MKLKIKKGDSVIVIAGNSKGATGRVLKVYPTTMRVLVEGVNLRSKAVRASPKYPNGGIVKIEVAVHYSNVQLVDKNGKATRIGTLRTVTSKKIVVKRLAKTTQEEL